MALASCVTLASFQIDLRPLPSVSLIASISDSSFASLPS
jgi:hypothetical protein